MLSSARGWGLRVTFWHVWVTSIQFRADITGWLPRKKAKTPGDMSCGRAGIPYFRKSHFWSPPDLHAFIVIKAGVGIPRIGILPCTKCFAPLWMSLKTSCPLAQAPGSQESPRSCFLCDESEVYKCKERRQRKIVSICMQEREVREVRQLSRKGIWFILSTWLCFFPEVYLLWHTGTTVPLPGFVPWLLMHVDEKC